MVQSRPSSLTSVGHAYQNYQTDSKNIVNLMGIIVDFLPPRKLDGRADSMVTFTIQDPDMTKIPSPNKGLKARFFHPNIEELPRIQSVGDVILIHACKVMPIQGAPLICNIKYRTSTVIFPAASFPDEGFHQAYFGGSKKLDWFCQPLSSPQPHVSEQMYVFHLKKELESLMAPTSLDPVPQLVTAPTRSKASGPQLNKSKHQLIRNVDYNMFCDLIVEVIKTFPRLDGDVELYVTDYTTNKGLFDHPSPHDQEKNESEYRDGDPYNYSSKATTASGWPGPFGQHTLMVELRPPHAVFARHRVKEGDFIMLQNVRIKESHGEKMEGNLWQDRTYPDKVGVKLLRDQKSDTLVELINRRQKYWANYNNKQVQAPNTSKKGKQKKKKKGKNEGPEDASNTASISTVAENKHVRCSNTDVLNTTLANLESYNRSYTGKSRVEQVLPFMNHQRRVKVRVVDFWPPLLEDFARPAAPATATGEASEDEMDLDNPADAKWEWNFFLLLEDAKPSQPTLPPTQQWVHVQHAEAQFLLSIDENATNLRQSPQTLAAAREKLAILWGNLEELKIAAKEKDQAYPPEDPAVSSGLSNLPFECCIREYAQELDAEDNETEDGEAAYVRLYDMYGARIL